MNTVKGYAAHESSTLENVVKARSEATQMKLDADNLTPEKLAQYQKAQGNISAALGRLLMVAENYPQLKANENFINLQEQLEGTENRITVARRDFNNSAKEYNVAIRRFPKTFSPDSSDLTRRVTSRLRMARRKHLKLKF